eukprot:1311929-Pyramimonas_sp.AAC.1
MYTTSRRARRGLCHTRLRQGQPPCAPGLITARLPARLLLSTSSLQLKRPSHLLLPARKSAPLMENQGPLRSVFLIPVRLSLAVTLHWRGPDEPRALT